MTTETDIQTLIRETANKLGGSFTIESDNDSFRIDVDLADGRSQRVLVWNDGLSIRFATRVSSWADNVSKPNLLKTLLRKNWALKHGYFALDPEGAVEMVDSQLLETCDVEELYLSICNLAEVGDFMEQKLARSDNPDSLGGPSETDVF